MDEGNAAHFPPREHKLPDKDWGILEFLEISGGSQMRAEEMLPNFPNEETSYQTRIGWGPTFWDPSHGARLRPEERGRTRMQRRLSSSATKLDSGRNNARRARRC